jgi:uncharacterized protein YqeY
MTLPGTGIENRLKGLRPTVTELSDSEMLTFLHELAEQKRHDAITEYDVITKQGLVDEARSLDLIAERLSELIDYMDQGETKRKLGESTE